MALTDKLVAIGNQVRRLFNTEDEMTLDQMALNLSNVVSASELPSAEESLFGVESGESECGIKDYKYSSTAWNRNTAGWEFTAREAFSIVGLRYYEGSFSGYNHILKVWNSSGECVATATCAANDGYWSEVMYLDNPINVAVGETHIVSMYSNSVCSLAYSSVSDVTFNPKVTYNRTLVASGNAFPSAETGSVVPIVDIIISPTQAELPNVYQVQRTTLDDIAEEAQRISGTTTKMTMAQIEEELSAVILQEKTVTPTAEQQEVVPDSGYYGLSKVTVEAAETSGGGSMFASNASGRIPEYEKGTALSEFTLDFESSAVGALQEG